VTVEPVPASLSARPSAKVDVIVLAAGRGSRLNSTLPKVLHELMGRPLLGWVLEALRGLNVGTCYVVLGHEKAQVERYLQTLQDHLPFECVPVLQEEQKGTAHAVFQVEEAGHRPNEQVLLLSGDVPLVTTKTLQTLLQQQHDKGQILTLAAARLQHPAGYGRIIQDAQKQPIAIVEERDASPVQRQIPLVNAGLYCLNWPALLPLLKQLFQGFGFTASATGSVVSLQCQPCTTQDQLPSLNASASSQRLPSNAQGEYYFTDLVAMAHQNSLKTGLLELSDPNEMLGINTREQLIDAHQLQRQRVLSQLMAEGVTVLDPATTWIDPGISIGRDTVIYPGCVLKGSITVGEACVLGPNTVLQGRVSLGQRCEVLQSRISDSSLGDECSVGPFAHLRDGVLLDKQVRIGNFVELKNTQIASGSFVSHLAYVGDAELGRDVNFGAGSITANFDSVRNLKSRTVIEDGVKVGSNCVLIAPITIGQEASIAAGSVITDTVEPGALAIARPRQSVKPGWVARAKAKAAAEEAAQAHAQPTSPQAEAQVSSFKVHQP
jgi:bifunctional UDP-N-acetylglucosamine pyrophosphorylase/glucosamine-1-phosphate N-acetyltransferase